MDLRNYYRAALSRPTGFVRYGDATEAGAETAAAASLTLGQDVAANNPASLGELFLISVGAGLTVGLIMKYVFGRH